MTDFETIKIDGESYFLRPWENQKGTRYGPTDRDEYEVTIINLTDEMIDQVVAAGRNPTRPARGSSKDEAGIADYYKVTSRFKIPLVDSQNNPIPDETLIPNGSKIRVYCEVRPIAEDYRKGNSHKLYCRGVQILEMAELPEDDDFRPGGNVFEVVEGGYSLDSSEDDEPTTDLPFEEVQPGEDPLA